MIRREDMDIGGTVLVLTRMGNGAAVSTRKRRAKVIDINRHGAEIEWCDDPKARHVMFPFRELEADPEFIDLREQKRAERVRKLDEGRATANIAPLKFSLADKLAPLVASADEQKQNESDGQQRTENVGAVGDVHAPEPTPTPEQTPISRALAQTERGPVAEMQLSEVQREIDKLEEEQTALLDMLEPLEQRLSQLKKRRVALRGYSQPAPLPIRTPDFRVGQRSYNRKTGT